MRLRLPRRWALSAAVALVALAANGCTGLPATLATSPSTSAGLQIDGASAQPPLRLDAASLRTRPVVTQAVHFDTGHGPQSHTYAGTSLWPLLQDAGLRSANANAGAMAAPLDRYIVATGADGYRTLFSAGELNPEFGNEGSIVAYAEVVDGASKPLSASGQALRLTAPGDLKGGRYVSDLKRIEVRPSGSKAAATGGGFAPAFAVSGVVDRPQRFDLAALQALPQTQQTVNGRRYDGVDLRILLGRVGVQKPASPAMNAGLMNYVVATGSDGYKVVLSAGEIDPGFGNRPVMLALAVDGKVLGDNGMARLIVPGDARMGRSVSRLVALEVMQAP